MGNNTNKYRYKFTVFTPTYNRAHTLARVYNSLKNQTYTDFEWLIVDDGSTDNTEEIVNQWIDNSDFSIRYIQKENAGKHTAINVGVQEALGELFLIFDSDDACVPEALEVFKKTWDDISNSIKGNYTGVTAVGMDFKGNVLGSYYPFSPWDISHLEILTKYKVYGDKWGFNRTEIMQEYPFPEIKGEKFITEGLIWNRISQKYIKRNINNKLKYIEYQKDGLSSSFLKLRVNNPKGSRLYYQEFISLPVNLKWKIRNAINYIRFSLHGKVTLYNIISDTNIPLVIGILMPIGYIIYLKDNVKLNKE